MQKTLSITLTALCLSLFSHAQLPDPVHFNRAYASDRGNSAGLFSIAPMDSRGTVVIGGTIYTDEDYSPVSGYVPNPYDLQDFTFFPMDDQDIPHWMYSTGVNDDLMALCEFNRHIVGVGVTNGDMFVIELDYQTYLTQTVVASNKFSYPSGLIPSDVKATSDGGLIIVGKTGMSAPMGFIMKLDAAYNITWMRTMDTPNGSTGDFDWFHAVKEMPDGNFIVCGSGNQIVQVGGINYGTSNGMSLVLKVDPAGHMMYYNAYNIKTGQPNEFAQDITYDRPNDKVIIASASGYTHNTYLAVMDYTSGALSTHPNIFRPYGSNIYGYSLQTDDAIPNSVLLSGYGRLYNTLGGTGLPQLFSMSFDYINNVENWAYAYPTQNSNVDLSLAIGYEPIGMPHIATKFGQANYISGLKNPQDSVAYAAYAAYSFPVQHLSTYHPIANSIVPTAFDGAMNCQYYPIDPADWANDPGTLEVIELQHGPLGYSPANATVSPLSLIRKPIRKFVYGCDNSGALRTVNSESTTENIIPAGANNIIVSQTGAEISVRSDKAFTETVYIYNALGQVLYTGNAKESTSFNINISDWASGIYYVRSGKAVAKFCKY
ncbi:T9SS type A sorting domain-containing protein [Taibaiella soli]|uniref:Secretion system C-terminal sorting domain-containing protein n=1 Tax=Taibaiella soli TaxID=1649169 RepID=A0A2W2ADE8_9BACT|nr:T9SS type A sorting domain-containing protein [Taibaiella soli]PZF73465.1 hypothetical protein DN068_07985 [Taibaiella soli]